MFYNGVIDRFLRIKILRKGVIVIFFVMGGFFIMRGFSGVIFF